MRHRLAVFTGICAWVLIVSGAFVKNSERASGQAQVQLTAAIFNERTHLGLAIVVGGLTLALAVWTWRGLGWTSVGILAIDGALGLHAAPLPAGLGILHACLSQVFLACMAMIAVVTSPSWNRARDSMDTSKWPSLPSFAAATPVAVLIQIALGASYRHEVLSVVPHMAGSMAVILFSLVVSVVVLQIYPTHGMLRATAIALITITIIQVGLGITAFILPLIDAENTLAYALSTAGHVAVGALALSASLVLALQIIRGTGHSTPESDSGVE
jgi:hypothetical protein